MPPDALDRDLARLPQDPSSCLYRQVSAAARVLAVRFDAALEPSGLTANQFNLLMVAMRAGPLSIGELARLLSTDPSTLPRLLRPLLAAGLVLTRHGDDRRVKLVQLTARGRTRLRHALPRWLEMQRTLLAAIGDVPWQQARRTLAAIRHQAPAAAARLRP